MIFSSLAPYAIYVIAAFFGLLFLYVRTVVSEKAKNRALRQDIRKITEETESVKAQFQKEIEQIKKEHDLDIAKRKYQYESKRDAYNKFLIFLDSYNTKVGEELTLKFLPEVKKFMRAFGNARGENKKRLISTNFFDSTIELNKEAYAGYTKLKQETNAIKLSASPKVLESLNELESFTKETLEEASTVLQKLPNLVVSGNKDLIADYQNYMQIYGEKILLSKEYLIEYMRLDLATI